MEFKNDEKILLILDVDETLIHASEKKLNQQAAFKLLDYHVYKRPFLNEFLVEVKEDFLLAIWSSAGDTYVEEMVKRIIPEDIDLEFVWGRSRCTYRRDLQIDENGFYEEDPSNHYHYIKPLKKVKKQGYMLDRILIVDDSPHKSKDNFGNAIYPKEFLGDPNDQELKLLAKYLQTLKNEANVRRIEKRDWQSQIQ
ncbi:MAG: HAD family hydrolase [Bacteroidia bacterium]|nr:HAD family hydrolase [Bacteroidia bacterium]